MAHTDKPSVKERLSHELREYAALSAYLYVALGAVLLYKATLLGEHRFGAVPYGTAVVKALVLAKFMMLGQAAGLERSLARRSLPVAVLGNTSAFLLLLAGFTVLEEVVIGLIHHEDLRSVLADHLLARLGEIGASLLLMWLILLPYFALRQLVRLLGPAAWRRLFTATPGSDPA